MKVINLQLEERVLGIVRARSEIAHCSVAEIIRMAIQAAWKEQTGRDLPTYVPGSGGRRRSSRYESKYATVSLPPQWHAWIQAHAGCVAPWVKQALESFVLRPFAHIAPTGEKAERRQAMPPIQSRWPGGARVAAGPDHRAPLRGRRVRSMTISEALVEMLDDDAARAGMLAMVHNGRAVVRRGQHRVWEASEDGRTVWWQPDPKSSRCGAALDGPDTAARMISASLRGSKSFRLASTDTGACRHPRRLLGGGL